MNAFNLFLEGIEAVKLTEDLKDKGPFTIIAPVEEAIEISKALPQSKLIVFEEAGHLPFLQKDLKRRLYEC